MQRDSADDRLTADEQRGCAYEALRGLKPPAVAAHRLDAAQEPAEAASELDDRVPSPNLRTVEPHPGGDHPVAVGGDVDLDR